jgi:poly(3-hydroxybutyrate) depolymerase
MRSETRMYRLARHWPHAATVFAVAAFLAALSFSLPPSSVAQPLPGYNVDIRETSVSGLSSGGFFATQMQVAYSSIIKGAGVVAGGVYDCGAQMHYTQCMYSGAPTVATSISRTHGWSGNLIDDKIHLADHKVFLFSGTADNTVAQSVMNQLYRYYVSDGGFVPAANVIFEKDLNAGHTFPTDFDSTGNIACANTGNPWISNCGFDAAGAILRHIYGVLQPRNDGAASGEFIEFSQAEFIASPRSRGMDDTGWVYVPASCAAGEPCRLHVAFHGCQQYFENIGDKFIRNTGYTRWADTNRIVVLFPQTVADGTLRSTPASFKLGNPNGCWDWIGWYGNDFDVKSGAQMAAVKRMIERVASKHAPIPAPENLAVTGMTDNSVTLAWNSVADAAGYHVYRNGVRATSAALAATNFTDTGLSPGTTYTYIVRAVTTSGSESEASNSVTATTTGVAPVVPPPANLAVTGTTASSVSLAWTPANGVAGYNVYRATSAGGPWTKDNTLLIEGTTYTSAGLSEVTVYHYIVRSQNAGGVESAASNEVSAMTGTAPVCYTASNFHHVLAGRARASAGYALAKGSNQNMGLNNVFFTSTLKQTEPDYYVIGTCP